MYLNVAEIESAITSLHGAYPASTEAIDLPHLTHDGRTTRLLRVGTRQSDEVPAILLLGGMHAREWVPPDALISLAADLLEAHDIGTGLGYGASTFTAAQVAQVLEEINLFFFPCVNLTAGTSARPRPPCGGRTAGRRLQAPWAPRAWASI